jgi:DNA-binding response OmpR family regulator
LPRILLVDDEPLISMLVEGWLAELGCDVVGPARSVEEGLDLADDGQLDGAILDVNLAGENSYSVANALQEIATGDGSLDADSGFDDPILLAKPFNFDGVKAVLDQLLAVPRTRDCV